MMFSGMPWPAALRRGGNRSVVRRAVFRIVR
jgi:hypothetical protein